MESHSERLNDGMLTGTEKHSVISFSEKEPTRRPEDPTTRGLLPSPFWMGGTLRALRGRVDILLLAAHRWTVALCPLPPPPPDTPMPAPAKIQAERTDWWGRRSGRLRGVLPAGPGGGRGAGSPQHRSQEEQQGEDCPSSCPGIQAPASPRRDPTSGQPDRKRGEEWGRKHGNRSAEQAVVAGKRRQGDSSHGFRKQRWRTQRWRKLLRSRQMAVSGHHVHGCSKDRVMAGGRTLGDHTRHGDEGTHTPRARLRARMHPYPEQSQPLGPKEEPVSVSESASQTGSPLLLNPEPKESELLLK